MLKILHTSDSHWNERGRMEDTLEMHRLMLQRAREEGVDLIVHAGDFFERRSTAIERTRLAEWLQAAATIAPVFGVRGNHDAPGDLEVFNRLETRYPIRITERATAEPGSAWMVDTEGGPVGCLGMAWIDKAHLVGTLDATRSAEETREIAIATIRDLLVCMRAEATRVRQDGGVPILVTHVMLGGSVVSSGQILIGQGIDLSPSDLLGIGCAYVACGHIHVEQAWFNGRVAYSGNPTRHDMGEAREHKGFRLVTIDDAGEFVSSDFIELPARRMVLLEADWTNGVRPFYTTREQVEGAEVRFRYRVKAEDLHLVSEEALLTTIRGDGAHLVHIEAVVESQTRIRSEEILRVQTTPEKLLAFWRAKGIDVDEATRARVLAHLAELEATA